MSSSRSCCGAVALAVYKPPPTKSPQRKSTIPAPPRLLTAGRESQRLANAEYKQLLKTKPAKFRFLDLPAEIRNQIYQSLYTGRIIYIGSNCNYNDCKVNRNGKRANNRQPPLARTCRALRQELLPMFYSQNRFELTCICRTNSNSKWLTRVAMQHPFMSRLYLHEVSWQTFWKTLLQCEVQPSDTFSLDSFNVRAANRHLSYAVRKALARATGASLRSTVARLEHENLTPQRMATEGLLAIAIALDEVCKVDECRFQSQLDRRVRKPPGQEIYPELSS